MLPESPMLLTLRCLAYSRRRYSIGCSMEIVIEQLAIGCGWRSDLPVLQLLASLDSGRDVVGDADCKRCVDQHVSEVGVEPNPWRIEVSLHLVADLGELRGRRGVDPVAGGVAVALHPLCAKVVDRQSYDGADQCCEDERDWLDVSIITEDNPHTFVQPVERSSQTDVEKHVTEDVDAGSMPYSRTFLQSFQG